MATIPDRVEEAVDALIAKIQAEEATAVVEWVTQDEDPSDISERADLSTDLQTLYHIIVLGLDEVPKDRQTRKPKRWQTGDLILRSHRYERTAADLGRAQARHVRKMQNWIEELDDGGAHRTPRGWWVDWYSWRGIQDEAGKGPSPGIRLVCQLGVNQ